MQHPLIIRIGGCQVISNIAQLIRPEWLALLLRKVSVTVPFTTVLGIIRIRFFPVSFSLPRLAPVAFATLWMRYSTHAMRDVPANWCLSRASKGDLWPESPGPTVSTAPLGINPSISGEYPCPTSHCRSSDDPCRAQEAPAVTLDRWPRSCWQSAKAIQNACHLADSSARTNAHFFPQNTVHLEWKQRIFGRSNTALFWKQSENVFNNFLKTWSGIQSILLFEVFTITMDNNSYVHFDNGHKNNCKYMWYTEHFANVRWSLYDNNQTLC